MKAIVVHSGGMDSSICLALAVKEFGSSKVMSLSFDYGQRHSSELEASKKVCAHFGVENTVIEIGCLNKITTNSLLDHNAKIGIEDGVPNTLVSGRNGLMARVAGIHADSIGVNYIYMGIARP